MIKVTFVEPNFEAEITDLQGRKNSELHSAASEGELRTRLEKRIAKGLIGSVGAITAYSFADWRKKADDEAKICNAAMKAGTDYTFKASIWGALKEHLITLFRAKCAYCETNFKTNSWGDVEHYRPKGKVTDEKKVEVVLPNGKPHPGYYWEAYNHVNYVPSCSLCNGANGKLNKFPVTGKRATAPEDDLSQEQPLLLNPLVDDPAKWLTFIPSAGTTDFGTVSSTNPRGLSTRDIVWLNREELVEERRAAQQAARLKVKEAVAQEDVAKVLGLVKEFQDGVPQYSAAALAEINSYLKKMHFDIDED